MTQCELSITFFFLFLIDYHIDKNSNISEDMMHYIASIFEFIIEFFPSMTKICS